MTSRYQDEEFLDLILSMPFQCYIDAMRMSIFEHSKKQDYEYLTCFLFRSTTPHVGIPIWRLSLRHGSLFLQSPGDWDADVYYIAI